MIETLFGSPSPIWPAMPAGPFTAQQPMFGPIGGAVPASTPVASALAAPSSGVPSTSGLTVAYPFASAPSLVFAGGDALTGVSATQLLGAVAMRRGQPQGPTNDQEIEEFIFDALDMLAGAADVDVRSDNGRVTLTGSVPHKRIKRDIGEIVWAIPPIADVSNNVTIAPRRRGRSSEPASVQSRKQA